MLHHLSLQSRVFSSLRISTKIFAGIEVKVGEFFMRFSIAASKPFLLILNPGEGRRPPPCFEHAGRHLKRRCGYTTEVQCVVVAPSKMKSHARTKSSSETQERIVGTAEDFTGEIGKNLRVNFPISPVISSALPDYLPLSLRG